MLITDNKLSSKPFLKPTSFFNIKPSNFEEKEDPKTPPKTQNNPFLLLQKNDSDEGAQSTDSSVKKENSNELDQAGQTRLNLFSNASNVKTTALLTENVGFVFGQNLHERVVSTQNSDDFQKNATLDLLFSSKTSDNDRTEVLFAEINTFRLNNVVISFRNRIFTPIIRKLLRLRVKPTLRAWITI